MSAIAPLLAAALASIGSALPKHRHALDPPPPPPDHPALASWFYDAGSTACGFHATYGYANKTLACGTRVEFDYHGRRVTGTLEDRGPFVAGRDFDLNPALRGALGCPDLCYLRYRVVG